MSLKENEIFEESKKEVEDDTDRTEEYREWLDRRDEFDAYLAESRMYPND
jgi:DNA-binding transcriptional regulator GbsR (MarR family)